MTQCKWRPIRHPLFLSSLLIGFNFIPATATAGEIVNNPLDYSSSNTLLLQKYKDNYVLPFYKYIKRQIQRWLKRRTKNAKAFHDKLRKLLTLVGITWLNTHR